MFDKIVSGFSKVLKKVFGSRNQRLIDAALVEVGKINALEEGLKALDDDALRARTASFKERLEKGETLDDLLPEAFAVAREAAVRTLGMRPYDVQLVGGYFLHGGHIIEMMTGEGKTLAATLPAYLNALTGRGVHVVTVNDYLAGRDAEWMGQVYGFLGLTTGAIQSNMPPTERQQAYACDITYGTNNEFGFDYLRDNMKVRKSEQVQRELHYAIIDEVDSILIDEARTPLIISGLSEPMSDKYMRANQIAKRLIGGRGGIEKNERDHLVKEDENQKEVLDRKYNYVYSEKDHSVFLTESGVRAAEDILGIEIYGRAAETDKGWHREMSLEDAENLKWVHYIEQALRANMIYKKDVDYVVQEGQVIIVDSFTGRLMHGRQWSDGLHQAVQAKEGIKIKAENQVLATITLQNYFLLYEKLSGMTGTAMTEAEEFDEIYKLECVKVPTNRPVIREDHNDLIYRKTAEKDGAIVEEIVSAHERGQPVLVGTESIEYSEKLAGKLNRRGVPHEVLNAKQHAREADIVAKAGEPGAVTIATNMAGRGTDIKLGEGVKELGGLYVIGTSRHDSRRIDNQLRGRSGRQGDPGKSRFFLSIEDDLMRRFMPDWVRNTMNKLQGEGEAIEHKWVTRSVEKAQKKVEAYHFDIRKNLLKYDKVMDYQRKAVYDLRQSILDQDGDAIRQVVLEGIDRVCADAVEEFCSHRHRNEWDLVGLTRWFRKKFGDTFDAGKVVDDPSVTRDDNAARELVLERMVEQAKATYERRIESAEPEKIQRLERVVLLNKLDKRWKDHLHAMDQLKSGIGYRGMAGKDPEIEFKRDGSRMFDQMLQCFDDEVTDLLFKVKVVSENEEQKMSQRWKISDTRHEQFVDSANKEAAARNAAGEAVSKEAPKPIKREAPKVGRNDPCPCGSKKKYKKCCGKIAAR